MVFEVIMNLFHSFIKTPIVKKITRYVKNNLHYIENLLH